MYISRDHDGMTKLWRHCPVEATGPHGVYYHGVSAKPLLIIEDSTVFPELGLGQCGPLNLNASEIFGDGEPRKHGKASY